MVIAGGMAVDTFSSHMIRKKKYGMCHESRKRQSHDMFGMKEYFKFLRVNSISKGSKGKITFKVKEYRGLEERKFLHYIKIRQSAACL